MELKTLIFRAVRTALITLCVMTSLTASADDATTATFDTSRTYFIDTSDVTYFKDYSGRPMLDGCYTGEAKKITNTLFEFKPDNASSMAYIKRCYTDTDGATIEVPGQADVAANSDTSYNLIRLSTGDIITGDKDGNRNFSYKWEHVDIAINGTIFKSDNNNDNNDNSSTKTLTESADGTYRLENVLLYPGTFGLKLLNSVGKQIEGTWFTGKDDTILIGTPYQLEENEDKDFHINNIFTGYADIIYDPYTFTMTIEPREYHLVGDVNRWLNSGSYSNDGTSYSYGYNAKTNGTIEDYTFSACAATPSFVRESTTTEGWYELKTSASEFLAKSGLFGQFVICDDLENKYGWDGTLDNDAKKYEYFYTNKDIKDLYLARVNSYGRYNYTQITSSPNKDQNLLVIKGDGYYEWSTMPTYGDGRYTGYKQGEYFIEDATNEGWWYNDNCSTYIISKNEGNETVIAKCNEYIASGANGNGVGINNNELYTKVAKSSAPKNFRLAHNYYTNATIYFNPVSQQIYIATEGEDDYQDLYIKYNPNSDIATYAEEKKHGPLLNINQSSINTINYKLDTYGTEGEMEYYTDQSTGESYYRKRIMPGMESTSGQLMTVKVESESGFESKNTWLTIKGQDVTFANPINVYVRTAGWDEAKVSAVDYRVYGYSEDGSHIQVYDPTANDNQGGFVDDKKDGTIGWVSMNRGTFDSNFKSTEDMQESWWSDDNTGTDFSSWTTDNNGNVTTICEQNSTKYIQLRFKYQSVAKGVRATESVDKYNYIPEEFDTSTADIYYEDTETTDAPYYLLSGTNKLYVSSILTGIEEIEADDVDNSDADATPIYYNLLGERVSNPTNGIYIRVVGNTATKVAL